jgi:hypothetical protein
MSIGGVNTLLLVINYLYESWIQWHVIIGLFEIQKTNGNAKALQLQGLLKKFKLIHHVFTFVKDEIHG